MVIVIKKLTEKTKQEARYHNYKHIQGKHSPEMDIQLCYAKGSYNY